jgi:hypothetical protein
VSEISKQKDLLGVKKTDLLTLSLTSEKSKSRLENLASDLDSGQISQEAYDQQVRRFDALSTYTKQESETLRDVVDKYNQKMHQLFQNLPQFLKTLSLWDREKECMFLSIEKFLLSGECGAVGILAMSAEPPHLPSASEALEIYASSELHKNYVSFQERLNLSSKVLLYIENLSSLKIDHFNLEEEVKGRRRDTMEFEDLLFIEDSVSLSSEDREILNLLLTGFFTPKSESNFSFVLCRLLTEEIFAKEGPILVFLKNFSVKIKSLERKYSFSADLMAELELVFLKMLQSEFTSLQILQGRHQRGPLPDPQNRQLSVHFGRRTGDLPGRKTPKR